MWDQGLLLGTVEPTELVEVRLQLHWATQSVAAASNAVLDRREDDSQSNLGWVSNQNKLASHPLPGGLHVAISLTDALIAMLDEDLNPIDSMPIQGQTLASCLSWLSNALPVHGVSLPTDSLKLRDYEMPEHAVGNGDAFTVDSPDQLKALAIWYEVSDTAFRAEQKDRDHASPVRCWPHHFDHGFLISLEPDVHPEHARSIGVGMSPGDGNYAEPYFYVNPYPQPDSPKRLSLPSGGFWHEQGWFGGILTATSLIDSIQRNESSNPLADFLQAAIEACEAMPNAGS